MDITTSYFQDGKLEGILIILQQLSIEDGFTAFATKSYITTRLTELGLNQYIEPIITEYYSQKSK